MKTVSFPLILSILISLAIILYYGYKAFSRGTSSYSSQPASYLNINATNAVPITDNKLTHPKSMGVYIGKTQEYDFSFDGVHWVTVPKQTEGTLLNFYIYGARLTSGSTAPKRGDILFLY